MNGDRYRIKGIKHSKKLTALMEERDRIKEQIWALQGRALELDRKIYDLKYGYTND